jgi:peptidoglycan hydrolase-like protein with peptidoglycan-binding domain
MNRADDFADKKRAVLRIQQWLRTLALSGFPLPLVIPDGIYGETTKEAVSIFQALSGIAATGKVDYVTWLALRDDYNKAVAAASLSRAIYPFEYQFRERTLSRGDQTPLVYIIQAMLAELISVYTILSEQGISGVYDEETAENVKKLQQVWQLPPSGNIDRETWNNLADAYNKNINRE